MKSAKIIFLTFSILISFNSIEQTNFEWQLKDSINKSKSEIYSITKEFISNTWKSANDVIQNDDKENGVILVKGLTKPYSFIHLGATYSYTYSYNVTFKMKENKYMIEISNVKCYSTTGSSFDNKYFIEPNDNCDTGNKKFTAKCDELKQDLLTQLNSIIESFKLSLKQASKNEEW